MVKERGLYAIFGLRRQVEALIQADSAKCGAEDFWRRNIHRRIRRVRSKYFEIHWGGYDSIRWFVDVYMLSGSDPFSHEEDLSDVTFCDDRSVRRERRCRRTARRSQNVKAG